MRKKFINKGASSLSLLLVILLAAGIGYFVWVEYGQELIKPPPEEELRDIEISKVELASPSPAPKLTPKAKGTPAPLLQGKETYTISQTAGVRPRIVLAEIDPHEPKVGENQRIRVRVIDQAPISEVTISLKSDNKTTNLPPTKLVDGTNLDGTWETSWNINDSILYTYVFSFKVQGTNVKSSVDLPIRLTNQ